VYTNVEKYGFVFRERKLTAAAYHPPEGKPRSMHPLFFDRQCSMLYEYQRAVEWVLRVSTRGTILA
jgi:hypothetical protein